MFPSLVASVFLAASALVRASPMVPRDNSGCVPGLVDKLNQLGMTISADQLQKALAAQGGGYLCDILQSQDVSLFLPQDSAYDSSNPSIGDDPLSIISYSIVFGTPEDGFKVTNMSLTRRGAAQSRSSGSSGLSWPGRSSRKRWNGLLDNNQVQIIDQLSTSSKKRWGDGPIFIIDRPVGSALVLQRSQWNNVGIFETDRLFTLPTTPSDLLCKPLISETPNGFKQFGGALQKAGLLDDIDNGFKSTVLAPTDDAFNEANIPKNQMASVLQNHFFFGTILYSTVFANIPQATAYSGKQLNFSYRDGVHYVQCGKDTAIILRSDVTSKWGVLHVINKVLQCD